MDTQSNALDAQPKKVLVVDGLLTTEDLRTIFHASESQVWRWYHLEGLPYLKLEKKCIRFRWEDVEQWMLARRCVDRSA